MKNDSDLIRAAVAASNLPSWVFAERIMGRNRDTVSLWRTGKVAISRNARRWLERWLALSDLERKRVIEALIPPS